MLRGFSLSAAKLSHKRAGRGRGEIETELNYLVSLVAVLAAILGLACHGDGLRRLRRRRG